MELLLSDFIKLHCFYFIGKDSSVREDINQGGNFKT